MLRWFKAQFLYAWYVTRHKWFVMWECFKRGLIWRGLTHDLSKLRPSEWFPYARYFYNKEAQNGETLKAFALFGCAEVAPYGYYTKDRFNYAWLWHQHRNDHHYQVWILTEDSGKIFPLPMSEPARKEMIADWIGAGRAIMGKKSNTKEWYLKNRKHMNMHPDTRAWVESQLGISKEDNTIYED